MSDINTDTGVILEALNDKADRNLYNLTSQAGAGLNSVGVRTVVETYRSGTSWYRIWSDGWIEQGGVWSGVAASSSASRNLLKTMSTTDYSCILQPNTSTYQGNGIHYVVSKTVSTVTISGYGTNNADLIWYVCGY